MIIMIFLSKYFKFNLQKNDKMITLLMEFVSFQRFEI